jgi:hypothetical protein
MDRLTKMTTRTAKMTRWQAQGLISIRPSGLRLLLAREESEDR